MPEHSHPGGEEIFFLDSDLTDEFGSYRTGDWVRSPAGSHHSARTEHGVLAYVKLGHLAG